MTCARCRIRISKVRVRVLVSVVLRGGRVLVTARGVEGEGETEWDRERESDRQNAETG